MVKHYHNGRRWTTLLHFRGTCDPLARVFSQDTQLVFSGTEGGMTMLTVADIVAILTLCLDCFALGYSMGSHDSKDTKK